MKSTVNTLFYILFKFCFIVYFPLLENKIHDSTDFSVYSIARTVFNTICVESLFVEILIKIIIRFT